MKLKSVGKTAAVLELEKNPLALPGLFFLFIVAFQIGKPQKLQVSKSVFATSDRSDLHKYSFLVIKTAMCKQFLSTSVNATILIFRHKS